MTRRTLLRKASFRTVPMREGLMSKGSSQPLDCPSAPAPAEGPRIFGVMTGTPEAHRVGYLSETVPVSEKLLALAGPAKPTQLFRIAAPCANGGCKQFTGNTCTLAQRIVKGFPAAVNALPACQIRS